MQNNMSSRGRGFSGGRGRGGSYRGSFRGGSRGGYDGGRGGRGGYSSYSSGDRYNNSGDRYNNTGDRYGSGRERDDSFKKSYRSESSNNYSSSRDYGRSGSPDRKRMRMEGVSGERRSHDGGHYGGSYGRQDSYSGERRSFAEERRRSPARDLYRKSGGMAPPRSPPPRQHVSRPHASRPAHSLSSRPPRRMSRGRPLRTRASYRGGPRSSRGYHVSYTRVYRALKGRSSIKSKPESASSTEEDWDAEDKEDEQEEKKSEVKTKSPKLEEGEEGEEEEEVAGDGDETDKEGAGGSDPEGADRPAARQLRPARPYVSLLCVHCKEKPLTFVAYAKHLVGARHRAAMGVVARKHKSQLIRMRLAQRRAQRELEAAEGAELTARTTFCPVCRLNHRTTRHAHNVSDTHRAMKRFLNPYCRVCRLTFRSPMVYEHHIVQLDHIKRKAAGGAGGAGGVGGAGRRASPKAEGSADEGMDVDLDNFMTLDSVGDVDEVDDDDEDSGAEKKEETEKPKKPKKEINIGSEHIKKVEVWWCGLCRVYLNRTEPGSADEAEVRRRHCRLRQHLGRYVQHRDTRTLRRHAERIHRQLTREAAEKENASAEDNQVKEEKSESAEDKNKSMENGTSAASAGDDKLWADVDKDIGDLLREVAPQGNVASDDEEDLDRYDKFRKSDKKLKGEDKEEAADDTNEKANSEIEAAA